MGNWVPGSSGGFVNAKQSHWVIPGYDGFFYWHPLYDPSPDVYIQKAAWAVADFFEPDVSGGRNEAFSGGYSGGDGGVWIRAY